MEVQFLPPEFLLDLALDGVDDAPAANVLFPGADCYLRVRLGASEIKTEVDKRSHAPVWAMTCELQVDVAHAQEVRKIHFICLLCIH